MDSPTLATPGDERCSMSPDGLVEALDAGELVVAAVLVEVLAGVELRCGPVRTKYSPRRARPRTQPGLRSLLYGRSIESSRCPPGVKSRQLGT